MKKHELCCKMLHILLMVSSLIFTIYAAINDKSDGVGDYVVYIMLYGLVLAPPVLANVIYNFVSGRKGWQTGHFGEKFQIITAALVIITIITLGYLPNDIDLLLPWFLLLAFDILFIAIKRYHGT